MFSAFTSKGVAFTSYLAVCCCKSGVAKCKFYSKFAPYTYMNFTQFFDDAMKRLNVEEVKLLVIILWGLLEGKE